MIFGIRELRLSLYLFLGMVSLGAKESICIQPDIRDEKIVFVQGGNLWFGEIDQNHVRAIPLLKENGAISYPKFSKNGERIAFVGKVDFIPNWDLFSLDLNGDNLERHTFTGIESSPCTWLSEKKIAYQKFSKNIAREKTLALVDLQNPISKENSLGVEQSSEPFITQQGDLFFVRFSPQSVIESYRGGQLRQIYKGCYGSGDFREKKIPLFDEANCFNPMVIDNSLYFLSDVNGKAGLYVQQNNTIQKIYEDNQFPILSASTDGKKIILSIAADLKIFDPYTKTLSKLEIELVGENIEKKSRVFLKKEIRDLLNFQNPSGYYLQEKCAVQPELGLIAFLIRGDVFCLKENTGGFTRIRSEKGNYIYDLAFSEKKIFALSSNDRGVSLEIRDIHEGAETYYLSDRNRTKLVVNNQGTKVATISSQQELFVYDTETKKERLIDKNIPFVLGKEAIAFSSDGKWLAYSIQKKNLFWQLKVYDFEKGVSYPLTAPEVDGFNPIWHPKQASLYFLSRSKRFPVYLNNPEKSHLKTIAVSHLMGISFNQENPFKLKEIQDCLKLNPSLFTKKTYNKTPFCPAWRMIAVGNGMLLFGNQTSYLPFLEGEIEHSTYEISDAYFSPTSNKGVVVEKGVWSWADLSNSFEGGVKEEISISSQTIFFEAKKEFEHLFYNVHRTYKSYFYDQNLQENFWTNLKKKYLPLLERVHNKKDLVLVLSMMLAELNTLHIFIVDLATPVNNTLKSATLPLELEYDSENQGFRILKALEIDPLIDTQHTLDPYKDFKEGSLITSINGEQVVKSYGIEAQLFGTYGGTVQFELQDRNGQKAIAEAKPIGMESLLALRLYDWSYANRMKVDKVSKGKVGYIYLSEMSPFTYGIFSQLYNAMLEKEGIIIDLRYNYGGNTSESVLEELLVQTDFSHQMHGIDSCFENQAKPPKIVVLCNQQTCSDGELFITKLKTVYKATVIGTKTWGGGVGICPSLSILPGCSLMVTLPAHASYIKGKTQPMVEKLGAEPIDIYLDISPRESFEKKDLQLAKALEILLESKYERNT